MSDLEAVLRNAIEQRVTVIRLDTSRAGSASASAWKAFDKYHTAYHPDPIQALLMALEKALAPKKSTDLSDLLS